MTAAKMPVSLQVLMVSALTVIAGNPSHAYEVTVTTLPFHGLARGQANSQPPAMQGAPTAQARSERMAKVRALQGKYAFVTISSDDYLRMKHELRDRF